MYTLHIGNKNYSSWSLRPWALMSELGIPFREQLHVFGAKFNAKAAGSPSGKVPVLVDDGTVVWDSLAIAEYLAERHPGVWPADAKARAWARSAAAEMHSGFPNLRNSCSMNCAIRVKLRNPPADLQRELDRLVELWHDGLTRFGGPFLAGPQFTAVDAFYCPVAFRVQSYHLELGAEAMAYVKRLLALPSMQRWYQAGIAEPYRDEPHEAEIAAAGTIVQDLRTGKVAASATRS